MRTTLTIDDDVASRLRPLLKGGKPKKVINDLLRKALGLHASQKVELPTFDLGWRPEIDPTQLNRIAAELEEEEDIRRFLKSTNG